MNKKVTDTKTLSPLSLRKNFSWTLVGNLVNAASQWGILIILAKLEATGQAGEYTGLFTLGLAIAMPIFTFSNLNLRAIQVTDAKREYEFGNYLGLRLLTTPLALFIIAIIIMTKEHSYQVLLILLVVGIAKSLDAISDIFYGLYQHSERMDRIAKSMVAKGVISLGAIALVIYFTSSIFLGMLAFVCVKLGVLLLYELPMARPFCSIRPSFKSSVMLKLLLLSLPLGVAGFLVAFKANTPNYFIEYYYETKTLGIFAAMANIMIAGTVIITALNQSSSARLARYFSEGKTSAFKSLIMKLAIIAVTIGGCGLLLAFWAGKPLLSIIYKPEYAMYSDSFVWIMTAAIPVYLLSVLGTAITAMRKFYLALSINIISLFATLIMSFLLIPEYALKGAALAILSSASFVVIFVCILVLIILKRREVSV